MEMAFVPEVSMLTPGVNRTMSWKSRIPRSSSASWLNAVMDSGTRLMLSSRRVAVTVISCSALPPAALSSFSAAASAACARPLRIAAPMTTPASEPESNRVLKTGRASGMEWIFGIVSPRYMSI